ncbi:hypothetical protein GCM10009840_18190 [Pseudolysinimonas kribbensis]|uniref:Uncharacterized protein n=1 Tax=Pseudolysinimonas kribbensis TaxID=433641 RepID=A0ABQ6K2K4_9MICO|nr:hypothetical protein [Pseudolysinimonas kribbensis]GMA93798.1 hypothetical protein GCM10025881_06220 [Pseudolysinimonas kribbensis]
MSNLATAGLNIEAYDARYRAEARVGDAKSALREYTNAVLHGDTIYADAVRKRALKQGWAFGPLDGVAQRIDNDFHAVIVQFNVTLAQVRDQLAANQITAQYATQQIQAKAAELDTDVDGIVQQADTFTNAAQQMFDAAVGRLTANTGDTNQQLLNEMRIGRAWERLKAEFNADPSLTAFTITQRISRGDINEVAAVLTELPSYLAASGRGRDVDTWMDAIYGNLRDADPVIAAAARDLKQAQRLQLIVAQDARTVRSLLADSGLAARSLDSRPGAASGYVNPTSVDYAR